ncbi:hypothetical protein OYC64_002217 [Pagothenia borchgrevinki]|uniref:Uncharacterized protein n=1 Tax=Pagothenia borchgrevinki TaxID=8213 RepID=A0ABD2H782_PAGBO
MCKSDTQPSISP